MRTTLFPLIGTLASLMALGLTSSLLGCTLEETLGCPHASGDSASAENVVYQPTETSLGWRGAEAHVLKNHVQLTFDKDFHKAGEGYFSPDRKRFVFQAIDKPLGNESPSEIFTMYLAEVAYDDAGRMTGLTNVRRISPEGSANTCGWFDPHNAHFVYFASTLTPLVDNESGGYQREAKRYKWAFPPQMRIVRYDMRKPAGDMESLTIIAGNETAYQAEDALSPDGRHMVYSNLDTGEGDLYVMDLKTGSTVCVVNKPGYDGGPFFSPDGKRICYRSDRYENNLLQVFVADLKFDNSGSIVGIQREYQLTNNSHVNWAPYWHPDGRHIIYTSSQLGHRNYEVFLVDADPGNLPGSPGPVRYGSGQRRLTFAERADVLPIFSDDGQYMTWTTQRGGGMSQLWAAEFILELDDPSATPPSASPHH